MVRGAREWCGEREKKEFEEEKAESKLHLLDQGNVSYELC